MSDPHSSRPTGTLGGSRGDAGIFLKAGKKGEDVTGFGQVMNEIGFLKKALEERDRMDKKLSDMFRLMLGTQKRLAFYGDL